MVNKNFLMDGFSLQYNVNSLKYICVFKVEKFVVKLTANANLMNFKYHSKYDPM